MTTKVAKRKTISPPVVEEKISPTTAVDPAPLAWLTLEVGLYALIIALAIGLRLWQVGAYPLSNQEANQSLIALAFYQDVLPEADPYSPLLLSLNTLTFFLFGASDGAARLAPVLLGIALVLLPLTLRRHLGPRACLIASVLLAISPSALFLSRTLNSEIGVAVGALMIVSGFFNWTDAGRTRWLWLLAGGLALLLASGPLAYSIILIFALIVLAKFSSFKALVSWAIWLDQPPESDPSPPETAGVPVVESPAGDGHSESDLPSDQPQTKEEQDPYDLLRQAGLVFLISLAVLATTAGLNVSGFGQVTGFLMDWLNRFGFSTGPDSGFNAIFLLTIYEPLVVVAGLVGLTLGLLRKDLLGTVLAGWLLGLLVLDLFMGGRPPTAVILPLVPLTLLAGLAIADLWDGLRQHGSWGNEGILVGAGLVMATLAYIFLTDWLINPCVPEDVMCQYRWGLPLVVLALFVTVVIFFGLLTGAQVAVRGAALTGLALGLLITVNIAWRLNYAPLTTLAFQPLAGTPASPGLVELTESLAIQSEARVGDAYLMDVTLAGVDSPALRWQLRDYAYLNRADTLSSQTATTAIITPAGQGDSLNLGQAYFGQAFTLDALWSPVGIDPKTFFNWLIYREVDTVPPGNQVILWLQAEPG